MANIKNYDLWYRISCVYLKNCIQVVSDGASANLSRGFIGCRRVEKQIGLFNYSVLGLMLLISALIGVYYGWRGQKNTEEFLLGGRSMRTLPITMSLFASFVSVGTVLGIPSDIYTTGTQYAISALCMPFVMFVVIKVYLPGYSELRVSASYEYLELRFNKSIRILASL